MNRAIRCFGFVFALLASALPLPALAATLSVSPGSTSVAVGQTVTVSVMVGSASEAINAAAGTVNFPSDLLRVSYVSKASSVFTLWVQDPTFSNAAGTVSYSGVVPNPGFTGGAGRVISITFVAKKEGVAHIGFTSSQVLANDGNGTDVYKGQTPGTITIVSAPHVQVTTTPVPAPLSCAEPKYFVYVPSCSAGPWTLDCAYYSTVLLALLIAVFLIGMYLSRKIVSTIMTWNEMHAADPTPHPSLGWSSPVGLGMFLVAVGLFTALLHFAGVL